MPSKRFVAEKKGQAAVQVVIATAAMVFIGIMVLDAVYQGSVADYIQDESLGNMTANVTDFTLSNVPVSQLSAHPLNITNQTTEISKGDDAMCTAPCYFIDNYGTGNISVNLSGEIDADITDSVITADYYQARVGSSGAANSAIGMGNTIVGYMWTGLLFLGLGLLVLGAVFVLRIVKDMGA